MSAAPDKPERGYSFTEWTNTNPTQPQPGDKLDQEFDRTNESVGEVIDRLADIQRDDGQLANESVGMDQLTDDVKQAMGVVSGQEHLSVAAFNQWRQQLLQVLVGNGVITAEQAAALQ